MTDTTYAPAYTTRCVVEDPVENPVDNRTLLWETYEISTRQNRPRRGHAHSVETPRGRFTPTTSGFVGLSTIHRPYYSNHQISLLLTLKSNVKHPISKREVLS
jgi:hypothetical protein